MACRTGDNKDRQRPEEENEVTAGEKAAEAILREARLAVTPGNATARLRLAMLLDSAGHFIEALRQYDTLTRAHPSDARLWVYRGQTAESAGDTLEAFRSYDAAVRIYPDADILLHLANLYAEKGLPRSLQIVRMVADMQPDREHQAHARFVAGVYNARKKDFAQAIQLFEEATRLNYQYSEAYIEKALALEAMGKNREALETMQFASRLNTLNEDYYYWMGYFHQQLKQDDSARLRYQQALQLNPRLTEAKEKLKMMGAGNE